jgi:phosphatidylserine decarboxylase
MGTSVVMPWRGVKNELYARPAPLQSASILHLILLPIAARKLPLIERLQVLLQYLLPKQALTAFAGWVASHPRGALTTRIITWFVKKYAVNMAEAANPDVTSYATFNDFFTRALKPGARPLAQAGLICPVDGAISQFGRIEADQIFQAKGHSYSAQALLAGDKALAAEFQDGHFACLYLSPRDYHRIHMPCDGRLLRMLYVPGDLFSVNPVTARGVPGLFARNERVVCVFENSQGPFVLVLVGATIVGSMATVWHGVVNPPRIPMVRQWQYPNPQVHLKQGDEMGRFLLGSTVVMLFPKTAGAKFDFNPVWQPGGAIRLGEKMADLNDLEHA